MDKQIFGYTPSFDPQSGDVVKYAQAFEADGAIRIVTRNSQGVITDVELPLKAVEELAIALLRHSTVRYLP